MTDPPSLPIVPLPPGSEAYESALEMLNAVGLPTQDLPSPTTELWGVLNGDDLCGVVGLEDCGESGLLRSLAVPRESRGYGIGAKLVAHIFDIARARGMTTLYLLTEGADQYFVRYGFTTLTRSQALASIRNTEQFRSLCADDAVLMRRRPI